MVEGATSRRVNIELVTPDWQFSGKFTIPAARMRLEDWLPFLYSVANLAGKAAEAKVAKDGKTISCVKGCGACCRHFIGISLVEARALGKLVANMPEPRQTEIRKRFEAAAAQLDASGVMESAPLKKDGSRANRQKFAAAYFRQQIACPFLEEESCSIHQDRPLVCREYVVTSPAANCSRLFRARVDNVEVRVHLSDSFSRATAAITGAPDAAVPLVTALRLHEAFDDKLGREYDSIVTLNVLLNEIGQARVEG